MFRRSLVPNPRITSLLASKHISSNFQALPKPLFHQYRSLFIQTEDTPNDNALKFMPSLPILPEGETVEFLSGREAHVSPLARKLFAIDGVKTMMFGPNFITIQKSNAATWLLIKPEIFAVLTEVFTSGEPIFEEGYKLTGGETEGLARDVEFDEEEDDVVAMIKELIFTRIRPAIQEDGGDIEFVKFQEDKGAVYLRLKGACRSCDSSSVTLKNGIESMLKHYIEEVEEVLQLDEEELLEEEDPLIAIKGRNQAQSNAQPSI